MIILCSYAPEISKKKIRYYIFCTRTMAMYLRRCGNWVYYSIIC